MTTRNIAAGARCAVSPTIRALLIYALKRPGFCSCDYDSATSYAVNRRKAQRALEDINRLAWAVCSVSDGAARWAISGSRLSIDENGEAEYTPDQHFAIEYRAAIHRALLAAIQCEQNGWHLPS
jgi:hypothetical protein